VKEGGPVPTTRVLIVDDHSVVVEGVKAALAKHENVEVVGEATNGNEAVNQVRALKPDLVIMDIAMPHFNGIEATFQIKKIDPGIKVIIFTMHSYQEFLVDLMRAGISAYVLKQNPISDLYLAIQVVRRGGTYLSEDASEFWIKHADRLARGKEDGDLFDLLSVREREVFQMLAEGNSVKQAAKLLSISTKTVETHKYHIMDKLKMRTMSEWTREAIRRGIIQV
jgi:two-component system response regulator NreC